MISIWYEYFKPYNRVQVIPFFFIKNTYSML